jgi:fatty-acyl-CoA synthase
MDGEGYITIVDRKKDMINTGGENVSSREVEEVIYEHPKVAEVAVFGVAHPRWIEAVTAGVVPRGSETVSQVEIIELCKQRLAPFKVPKYVVILEELPKNPSSASCAPRTGTWPRERWSRSRAL